MKIAEITQPESIVVRDLDAPDPSPDEVQIEVMASGICGTDVHIYEGDYMGTYPIVPGHEFAGVVSAVGDDVTRFRIGDRVAVEPNIACNNCPTCLENRQNFCENWGAVGVNRQGAMAQFVCVPESSVFGIGELAFEVGAFVEPLSCVVHGVSQVPAPMGASVLVIGAGPIGLLLVRTVRAMGANSITVVDRAESRAEFASRHDADRIFTETSRLGSGEYDLVIDATGAPAVLAQTLEWARPGGTILWFGVPGKDTTVTLDPFAVFEKGLTIQGSFTSLRNSQQALNLLTSGAVVVDDLISHRLALQEFEAGIKVLRDRSEPALKVLVFPQQGE